MRARTSRAKEERKISIVKAAGRLYRDKDYQSIKIEEIAREAGVAKGTVFTYFNTKEHVFLELIKDEYNAWFSEMNRFLLVEDSQSNRDIRELVPFLVEGFRGKETLLKLVTILNSIVERNIQLEETVCFKKNLSENLQKTGSLLEKRYTCLQENQGIRILLQIQGIIIGLRNLTDISPVVRSAIEAYEELSFFNIQFEELFIDLLSAYLTGVVKGQR